MITRQVARIIRSLPDPLSDALLPLVHGLTRHIWLKMGVYELDLRLAGIMTHLYVRHRPTRIATPPVVLIHGIADNALTWALLLPPMAQWAGTVYAVDLPGFGLSGYPRGRRYATIREHVAVIRDLITTQIGQPALLVGNSLGGWIAARLTLEAPELVAGTVLLDPGGAMLGGRADWEPFVQTVAVPDLRTVRAIYRQMFGQVPLPLYLGQRSFQALFLRDPVTQFVAAADENEFFRPAELQQLQRPVGLVWGERDTFLPAGSREFFMQHLPQPQVLTLPGCGHLPQRERPRQVNRFVRHFARTLERKAER
jgi:pimeloyl-ACP methyl ester carboxylesterase